MHQLLARSIWDIQTFEYYEHNRVIVGLSEEQLTEDLPETKKKAKLRHLHITLYFDPDYQPAQRVWCEATDGQVACWLHRRKGSLNPGVHPLVWFKLPLVVQT